MSVALRPSVRPRPRRVAGLLASFLASLLACAPVRPAFAAETEFARAASRLPPAVTSVTSCARADGSAQYRVVVFDRGFEHVSSEVYLQWLAWNEERPALLRSVLVAELSDGFWSVGETVVASRKTCAFRLSAAHTYSAENARFELRPSGRGKYSVAKLTRDP